MPQSTLASSHSDFLSDLDSLQSALQADAAAYVLLRRDPDSYVAITYVPDTAPVRQKMLFASTRLTLVRELGSEFFKETLFATTREELSREGWLRHDAHGKLDAPLTQEEQTLRGVREAEAEASRSTSARGEQIHTKGIGTPVSEDGLRALGQLKDGGDNLVQLVSLEG